MRNGTFLLVILAVVFGGMALLVFDGDGMIAGLRDDQFAQLLQLGAWGTVIGASVLFMARARPGRILTSAAVWIVAFVVLIGAYTFASDLRHVGERIRASLIPGSAISIENGEERQVMVMRGFDDHFHIDARINGTPIPLLVDTGASIVALDRTTAERIGIDVAALRYTTRVRTANGIAAAAPVRLATIRVGDIERTDVEAVVTEGDGIGIDLLGMSFLGTLSSVDFRGDRLVLTD